MDEKLRRQAIELYDRFTHEGMERRAFMAEMSRIAGGAAAAQILIGSIAASTAAAAIVPEGDRRLSTATIRLLDGRYSAYAAEPSGRPARSTVLVIHENRGLNAHIKDIARRLALAGHYAVAPDFLSPSGGTPANEDAARDAIGKLDLARATAAGVAMLDLLEDRRRSNGKVGAVGFCWGGAYVNRLAVGAGAKLDAGVVYYGPAPDPAEAARVKSPMLFHFAGLDERVNSSGRPWVKALRARRARVSAFTYPRVNHAFNNDTSAERYNKAAAELAWTRTLNFFRRTLA